MADFWHVCKICAVITVKDQRELAIESVGLSDKWGCLEKLLSAIPGVPPSCHRPIYFQICNDELFSYKICAADHG